MATVASNLCQRCGLRPQYVENGKIHPYCGRRCAGTAKRLSINTSTDSAPQVVSMCKTCGLKPRFVENGKQHPFCSRTCASNANDGVDLSPKQVVKSKGFNCCVPDCKESAWADPRTSIPSKWCSVKHKNWALACLWCRQNAKKVGVFCGQVCVDAADRGAPVILEILVGHIAYESVVAQFNKSWRHSYKTLPAVQRVYRVVIAKKLLRQYERYRASVEARGQFTKLQYPRPEGNENRRWHGTRRECGLGTKGQTQLCNSSSCPLCNILRTSFDLAYFRSNTSFGRFGAGIYTSSTSSKSDDYVSSPSGSSSKAMLLNKVVVGNGFKMSNGDSSLTSPPTGYDSVLGEKSTSLNHDELVVYRNDAIRPVYLVVYES